MKEHFVRDIYGILGVNRSSFYYQPRADPPEAVLRAEIEKLAGVSKYGYRRIRQLLVRQGYTVGTRRVARLMKENNLLVSVKRACQKQNRFRVKNRGATGSKPLTSLMRIRSGWLILHMSASRDTLPISHCSWMFSPESSKRGS